MSASYAQERVTEVIRLDNVSKKFIIHHERNRAFQEVVVNLFRSNGSHEQFWALRDVSFAVRKGETLGIIGHNGSGKSTTLKLISRIIDPTAGKITVNGSMSSLLELGAGFHPDLTGRDNVFLNGSLLGFGRREMQLMFADIVAFSELEQFIDVPVKHYSSGMYTRLAFAVAINVDPDILLVDEVLAVGDKEFQDKCLEKIRDFQKIGKTIILVSHSLEAVKHICNRAIWLDHGRIRAMGDSKKVVLDYLRQVEEHQETVESERKAVGPALMAQSLLDPCEGEIQIRDVRILSQERLPQRVFRTGEDMVVRLYYCLRERRLSQDCTFSIAIADANGVLLHRAHFPCRAAQFAPEGQRGVLELMYANLALLAGSYSLSVAVWPSESPDSPIDVYSGRRRFSIEGEEGSADGFEDGLISLRHAWLDSASEAARVATGSVQAPVDLPPNACQDGHVGGLPAHLYVGENDTPCLADGWYDAEGDIPRFRWTTGHASLFMNVGERASTLFLRASDPNASYRQLTGSVFVDGASVGGFEFSGPEDRSLRFSLNGGYRGKVGITIRVEPTVVPAQLGLNGDTRELGLRVYDVWAE